MKARAVSIACALLGLGLMVPNAGADIIQLTVADTKVYVGLIVPDVPSGEKDEVAYIQTLITLGPGDTLCDTLACGGTTRQNYDRTGSTLQTLPSVGSVAAKIDTSVGSWTPTPGIAGTFYFIGKYDQDKAGGLVFLATVAAGDTIELPDDFNGKQISHITALSTTATVPDGGTTLMLLGGAFIGIAVLRRRLIA